MWLDNLKALKKKTGVTNVQIAKETFIPERTIARIFTGETPNPTITTLIPIIKCLGGSLSEVFADTKAIVGDQNLATLQAEIDVIIAERDLLTAQKDILETKVTTLTAENELLKTQLLHKDELLAVHNRYLSIINKE